MVPSSNARIAAVSARSGAETGVVDLAGRGGNAGTSASQSRNRVQSEWGDT